MATTRPFAYNTGTTISGTIQFGNLAIGNSQVDYSLDYGGVKWWMGPDEDLGYVIAHENASGNQPNPVGSSAYVQFWRTNLFTDNSFLTLMNSLPARRGLTPFTNTYDGYSWLTANGYWTTFMAPNQTPTPTPTLTRTPTVTPTNTITPTPSVTTSVTPTNTITPTPSVTTSVTPTPTSTLPDSNFLLFESGDIATAENNDNIVIDVIVPTPTPTITPTNSVTPSPTPNLVTTGLVIQLDAYNNSSYPGTGTTVYDITGGYNHTLIGATYTVLNGIKCFDCTTGNNRVNYNSTGPTLPTTGYTYITWTRLITSNAGFRTLLYTSGPPKITPITIPNGTSTLGYWATGFVSSTYDISSSANVWVQLAVVGTNTSQKFYLNGAQVGSTINEGAGGTRHWGWGNNDVVAQPWGHVANMYFYNRQLSLSEITQQYNYLAPRFI